MPSYKALPNLGIKIFTPMHWVITNRKGIRQREYIPVIQGLLFAHEARERLDPIIAKDPSLQYQYVRGQGQATPMTVPEEEMELFMRAVSTTASPLYYIPGELTTAMLGKEIIVKGGPLDGYRGRLLKLQGSRKKRVIVSLEGFLTAAVEVNPLYLQIV